MNKDVYYAKKLIESNLKLKSGLYNYVYFDTNERVDEYFKYFDLKDKDVLTVASSGDHALQALSEGAKSVTMFDINKLTGYFAYLKIASIMALDYEEFINYFSFNGVRPNDNKYFLCVDLYKKVREYLPGYVVKFWDELYSCINAPIKMKKLFYFCENYENNSYLREINFYKLKKEIFNKQISFIHSSLFNLPKKLEQKYDVMFFSNIYDWLNGVSPKEYYKFIKEMEYYLNDDGVINLYSSVTNGLLSLKGNNAGLDTVFNEPLIIKTSSGNQGVYTHKRTK